jgi:hypothetical protein
MKTIIELKKEATLELRQQRELEKRRLVSICEEAIKRAIRKQKDAQEGMQVTVSVPGYHMYKKRGEVIFSNSLQEILDEYSTMGIELAVDWRQICDEKSQGSKFVLNIPPKLLGE